MASHKQREMPLKEFKSLISQLPPVKLAKLPIESLPEQIPLEIVESAPADVASTLEDLIFKQQSFFISNLHEFRTQLGDEAVNAYDLSIQPQLHGVSEKLFDNLKAFQSALQTRHIDSLDSATEALEALNQYFPMALKVSKEYLLLLQARKNLRQKLSSTLPADLAKMGMLIDRKLKRRLRTRRAILEQFYAQRLLLIAWVMQQTRKNIDEYIEKRQKLGTRLTSARLDIEEIELKWSKTPGNQLLTSRLSELRAAFDRIASEIKTQDTPIQRRHIDEWLSGIVDYRLLREKNERLKKLNKRSIEAISYLVNIYLDIESINASQLHEAKTMRPLSPNEITTKKSAKNIVIEFFHKRKEILETPYWIPEVSRNDQLEKTRREILKQIKRNSSLNTEI